ncbi:GAF domain-containing protein [Mangrovitalea sediminis]|uniref:GAF domain-containing protein n=1 Tax=Mangrovitalea sediminis TaxID=1982043 RepID=UPI0018E98A02|nr:GAF domain-containing protein [Mangrovitalea sediminis]
MTVRLDMIRGCLEGVIPCALATCDATGEPNITYVSQMTYIDNEHVGLSFQFFNKTRENILANPHVTAYVIHPDTAARYRLALLYLRTEAEGALFQSMKAKLAGIASHTGMSGVFRLQGADVYRVLDIEQVPGATVAAPARPRNGLSTVRRLSLRIANCTDLSSLLDQTLADLEDDLDIHYSMVLMLDQQAQKLFTVASRGYQASGVGSEIPLGCGVIGVAAEHQTPIRINHMTSEYSYSLAMRNQAMADGDLKLLETAIPFPGLTEPHSQLAVPILSAGSVRGVLYVESPEDLRFTYDDEDALVSIAVQLGLATLGLQQTGECQDEDEAPPQAIMPGAGPLLVVRHYAGDHSLFIEEDYLIKGVAGAILWRLLQGYVNEQRTDYSNRELRLDRSLGLPDIDDNLEARLILLQRRLAERSHCLRIEKTGRGRFRLVVLRPVRLVDVPRDDSTVTP